jgi:hypothetical protein
VNMRYSIYRKSKIEGRFEKTKYPTLSLFLKQG